MPRARSCATRASHLRVDLQRRLRIGVADLVHYVTVCESDGRTQIGEYVAGG